MNQNFPFSRDTATIRDYLGYNTTNFLAQATFSWGYKFRHLLLNLKLPGCLVPPLKQRPTTWSSGVTRLPRKASNLRDELVVVPNSREESNQGLGNVSDS